MSVSFKNYSFSPGESGFDLPKESETTPPLLHEIKTPNGERVQIDLNPRLNDSRLEVEFPYFTRNLKGRVIDCIDYTEYGFVLKDKIWCFPKEQPLPEISAKPDAGRNSPLTPEKIDDYLKLVFSGCRKPQTRPPEKTGQVDKSK
jgi:hypothetical protein